MARVARSVERQSRTVRWALIESEIARSRLSHPSQVQMLMVQMYQSSPRQKCRCHWRRDTTQHHCFDHCLAEGEDPISPDITSVCEALHLDHFQLPVIHTIRAQR